MHRRHLLALVPSIAAAQSGRPIRVVVPFGAGGIIDVVARIVAEPMGRLLGQTMVVENQPGAGSVIGARSVARAPADGSTLLLSGAAHAVIPALYPDAGVDPVADFATIALLGQQPFVLVVHPANPARDAGAFLDWLRARPGQARFATTGVGAASHLAGELLKKLAGVDFEVVPYRGTPQAVTDLVAGRVDFMLDSQTLLAPLAAAGQLRALAVTTAARSALLPELPAFAEIGLTGYDASSWQALYAPAATPAGELARLRAAAAAALADPTLLRRYAEVGVQVVNTDLAHFIAAEQARWLPILRETGARGG
ncbi:MAG: tripartite tricarboxylate transporter substrate binding protein [Rhodospirillales bacterium]|nr:tripartite tricarboxylate transporter substrate binding protein [Rhodospirillales bacterium]